MDGVAIGVARNVLHAVRRLIADAPESVWSGRDIGWRCSAVESRVLQVVRGRNGQTVTADSRKLHDGSLMLCAPHRTILGQENHGRWTGWVEFMQEKTKWYNTLYIGVDKKPAGCHFSVIPYFSIIHCSTCFGQPCAHHQELTTA